MPYPPNYGGIIDVYWKLYWLKKEGIHIHLHCFSYGRPPAKELEELCEKVYYYPRKTGLFSNLSLQPYTVKSRQSEEMEKILLANNYPILFEVLHTCYLLDDPRFKERVKIYRHSNIEHDYYNHLAASEKKFIKKTYLKTEAKRLETFESIVSSANYILAVNEKDAEYFKTKYSSPRTIYLPSFHPHSTPVIKNGSGDFILYHGNLAISENYEAADWLIENVFSKISHKVIIAGLKPPAFLKEKIKAHPNIVLAENLSEEGMNDLIENAQIHCLHTHQPTGLKLKLLNVLFKGRFILCNNQMLEGTGISNGQTLTICNTGDEYCNAIKSQITKGFTEDYLNERKTATVRFNNEENAKTILNLF